jgi:hypothetical protein
MAWSLALFSSCMTLKERTQRDWSAGMAVFSIQPPQAYS